MSDRDPLIEESTSYFDQSQLPMSQNLPIFSDMLHMAHEALKQNINPSLIYEGSSGSYFVYNCDKEVIGIFKPKNEEPYGKLNPKWLKWIHKIFFPCCFGRSCIIPNVGYLSEAAAFVIDQYLDLHIVPPTFVTCLVSPTFNYSKIDRKTASVKIYAKKRIKLLRNISTNLPAKIGSFQQFVNGYFSGNLYYQKPEFKNMTPENEAEFQYLLEKLAILDYIIRNTDRVNNWLLKVDEIKPCSQFSENNQQPRHHFRLAAIDNGLAFPFKHPDSWRSYPFDWAYYSYAKNPFSQKIKDLVLPKLSDPFFVASLVKELKQLFKIDKGFDWELFKGQMKVMRGQIYNIVNAFETNPLLTPQQLIEKIPIYYTITNHPPGFNIKPVEKRPFFRKF